MQMQRNEGRGWIRRCDYLELAVKMKRTRNQVSNCLNSIVYIQMEPTISVNGIPRASTYTEWISLDEFLSNPNGNLHQVLNMIYK